MKGSEAEEIKKMHPYIANTLDAIDYLLAGGIFDDLGHWFTVDLADDGNSFKYNIDGVIKGSADSLDELFYVKAGHNGPTILQILYGWAQRVRNGRDLRFEADELKIKHPFIAEDIEEFFGIDVTYDTYKGHWFYIQWTGIENSFNYGLDGIVQSYAYSIEDLLNVKVADDGTTFLQMLYEQRKELNEKDHA